MNENTVYWIWLQQAMGEGARVDDLLGAFPTARDVYESSDMGRRLSGVLTAKQMQRLENTLLSDASAILRRCTERGQTVVTPEDEIYPQSLRTLADMPLALYVRGDLFCLRDALSIAIVGSRNASLYSLGIARALARDLAKAGAVIVSGCALGVDGASHEGALYEGGKTVGVLGCGLDTPYLMSNAALRENVAKNGALVTEYPPGSKALPGHFPLRNRIISGLSSGTVVIEAGERSGSLITARHAAEQGRDVFGVPGDLTSRNFTGVHILQEYTWVYDNLHLEDLSNELHTRQQKQTDRPKTEKRTRHGNTAPKPVPSSLSDDAKTVYGAMGEQALYTDDLVRATKLEPNRVFTALTELEIYGLIQMVQGKRYCIKDE